MKKIVQHLLFSALALVIVVSCSDDDNPIVPAKFTIDLNTKDFGDVEVNQTSSQTFKITNKGEQALELKSFTLTGANKTEFTTNAVSKNLAGSKDYSFTINFAPTTEGSKAATLEINTNLGIKKIILAGNSTAIPVKTYTISPTQKDFGDVEVGKTTSHDFIITNTGNKDLIIESMIMQGNDFSNNGTANKTVAPNTSYTLSVIFSPSSVGVKNATLQLKTNFGNKNVSVTGNGTPEPAPIFNISATSKDYGNVVVNQTATQNFTINNTGNADLSIIFNNIQGTNASEFSTDAQPTTVSAGASYSFNITFAPTTSGAKTALLKVATNDGNHFINLSGTATSATSIGVITIPDANFKAALLANTAINTNGDQEIQISEAQNYNGTIDVMSKSIADLTGIEEFINITQLFCASNQLTNLDVSKNTKLTILSCFSNLLTSLDTSNNKLLLTLYCYKNRLTYLNVTQSTDLRVLYCFKNKLTNLDLKQNTALTRLYAYSNQLTSLDLSNNTDLQNLQCSNNQLTNLNLSNNTKLQRLRCQQNQLTSLDVSSNTDLQYLECWNNQITSLDVSNNNQLIQLYCVNNALTSLNAANGNNTNFTSFGVEGNPNLSCIKIDAGFTPPSTWTKDNTASYNTTCP